MAEQPVADAILRVVAAVLLKEEVVAAEVLLMILVMLVEREDVEVVANPQSVNEAPIDSHALSEDYSSSINNSNTQSSTQQTAVQPNVTVKVEVSPEFNISGGGQSDDEIVAVIRRHMGDVTDELCGKIASKLEEVFANMPLKGVGV